MIDASVLKWKWPEHEWTVIGDRIICESDENFKLSKKQIKSLISEYENSNLWRKKREDAYKEKEISGDIPSNAQDNIDEIWKALEAAELHGANLPPKASSIIRHRRVVKTKFKKPETRND